MDTNKVIENYKKICEFLLSQAVNLPVGTHMDFNLTKHVGRYASIEIVHSSGKAYLLVYDNSRVDSYPTQNRFYVGDDAGKISKTVDENCPSTELMKNLVIGWHRYGIKDNLLHALHDAEAEAIEKIEAEKEIDNFVV